MHGKRKIVLALKGKLEKFDLGLSLQT